VISRAASEKKCGLCTKAVELWCGAYGAEAGVVALKYLPYGGLFITGGVSNKLRKFICPSNKNGSATCFMEAFLDKGRASPFLRNIPVFLVRGEDMGEKGVSLRSERLYQERLQLRVPSARVSMRSSNSCCNGDEMPLVLSTSFKTLASE